MGKRYVSFTLGSGRYCLPVEQVLQIVRRESLIRIPKPPPLVEGVLNLRGEIVPVIDLRSRLAAPSSDEGAPRLGGSRKSRNDGAEYRRRVVVTRLGRRMYGLDVDDVREIVDLEEPATTPGNAAPLPELVAGVARGEGGEFMVLDLQGALGTDRRATGAPVEG